MEHIKLTPDDLRAVLDSTWRDRNYIRKALKEHCNALDEQISDANVYTCLQRLKAYGEIESTTVQVRHSPGSTTGSKTKYRKVGRRRPGSRFHGSGSPVPA